MNNLSLILLIVVILFLASNNKNSIGIEAFNNYSGTYCTSCYNKTLNSCNQCFNCGTLQDQFGNQWCVGGDVHGPYNKESGYGSTWKYIDPFSYKLQKQKYGKRRCSDGPSNATRAIGLRGL